MKPFGGLIPLDEAGRLILDAVRPVGETEEVPLRRAGGRVTAREVLSPVDVPPFPRVSMDGYAVRARDTFGAGLHSPVRLKKIETLHAGDVPARIVGEGECARLATGCMLPEGADAVVIFEVTEEEGDEVLVRQAVPPGSDVAPRGSDIARGAVLLSASERISPAAAGALAAVGLESVPVFRKPVVSILPTGGEIVEPGRPLKPGQIYNINTYSLGAMIEASGCEPRPLPPVGDVRDALLLSLKKALSGSDLVVVTGGSSVGDRDIMMEVLEKNGELLFHGVAVKPGKPTLMAVVDGTPVLGMPGNPTSCLSNAYIMLRPALLKMARLPQGVAETRKARMASRITSTLGRVQIFTVRLEGERAHPAFKVSSAITSLSKADGYIAIPANVDLVDRDEEVVVTLF